MDEVSSNASLTILTSRARWCGMVTRSKGMGGSHAEPIAMDIFSAQLYHIATKGRLTSLAALGVWVVGDGSTDTDEGKRAKSPRGARVLNSASRSA